MTEYPMTTEGKLQLDLELKTLIKVEREAIKKAIAEAREHGDLKENAEYHAAKEKQSHVEGRIMELQDKVAKAKVIDIGAVKKDRILFGATVEVVNLDDGREACYQIVGEDEARTSSMKISYNSPLAKALIGKEEGDEVIVKAPKGDIEYEIKRFHYS